MSHTIPQNTTLAAETITTPLSALPLLITILLSSCGTRGVAKRHKKNPLFD
jgi:hypothetical protein